MGINKWLVMLGTLGWFLSRRMDLVVQNDFMAHESAITIIGENELLRHHEVLF